MYECLKKEEYVTVYIGNHDLDDDAPNGKLPPIALLARRACLGNRKVAAACVHVNIG